MADSGIPPPTMPAALSIRNLRVDYGDFTAVDDLSLDLVPGEIFGLAGPNGAGKTSTIRVIASLLEPTYGDIEVCGVDLFDKPEDVHGLIGYMPDLAPVIPDLRVWEFLDLYAHSHGLRGTEKRDCIDACLASVKLADKRNVYGKGLSRGMKQRVVLAKTLLHQPRLLLLDEPASGMDPIARRDLREILESLAANGATVVISSHILSELSGMCTAVGIMHLGRLMRHGSMRELSDAAIAERVDIEIELIAGTDTAIAWLAARDGITAIRHDGTRIVVSFAGNAATRSTLLRDMLAADIQVSAFTPARTGIESMLMGLLDGETK